MSIRRSVLRKWLIAAHVFPISSTRLIVGTRILSIGIVPFVVTCVIVVPTGVMVHRNRVRFRLHLRFHLTSGAAADRSGRPLRPCRPLRRRGRRRCNRRRRSFRNRRRRHRRIRHRLLRDGRLRRRGACVVRGGIAADERCFLIRGQLPPFLGRRGDIVGIIVVRICRRVLVGQRRTAVNQLEVLVVIGAAAIEAVIRRAADGRPLQANALPLTLAYSVGG